MIVARDRFVRYEFLSTNPPRMHVRSSLGHYGVKLLGPILVVVWVLYGVVPSFVVLVAAFIGLDRGYDGGWNAATDSCLKYPTDNRPQSDGGTAP